MVLQKDLIQQITERFLKISKRLDEKLTKKLKTGLKKRMKKLRANMKKMISTEFQKCFDAKITPSLASNFGLINEHIKKTLQNVITQYLQNITIDKVKITYLQETLVEVVSMTRKMIKSVCVNHSTLFKVDSVLKEKRGKFDSILHDIAETT